MKGGMKGIVDPKLKSSGGGCCQAPENDKETALKYHNHNPYDSCTLMHIQMRSAAFIYPMHFHALNA